MTLHTDNDDEKRILRRLHEFLGGAMQYPYGFSPAFSVEILLI